MADRNLHTHPDFMWLLYTCRKSKTAELATLKEGRPDQDSVQQLEATLAAMELEEVIGPVFVVTGVAKLCPSPKTVARHLLPFPTEFALLRLYMYTAGAAAEGP